MHLTVLCYNGFKINIKFSFNFYLSGKIAVKMVSICAIIILSNILCILADPTNVLPCRDMKNSSRLALRPTEQQSGEPFWRNLVTKIVTRILYAS